MMHYDSFVVAIRDANTKKPFREYDHDRTWITSKSRLVIPFGTEYEFIFKIQDGIRRRVEITIDGTNVGEWVISGDGGVLERFKDSTNRFKFVEAGDARVSDPTSPYNGDIRVKVWKEKQPDIEPRYLTMPPKSWGYDNFVGYSYPVYGQNTGGTPLPPTTTTTCSFTGDGGGAVGATLGSGHVANGPISAKKSLFAACSVTRGATRSAEPVGNKGATVEGSKSGQTFERTHWEGDEAIGFEYIFTVRGPAAEAKPGTYCHVCSAKLHEDANFCHACSTKVRAVA